MSRRKSRPHRGQPVLRPRPPERNGVLFISQCTIDDFPNVDLSEYKGAWLTVEAMEQAQKFEAELQHIARQAEFLGIEVIEKEVKIAELKETIAQQAAEIERLRAVEKKYNKHKKGRQQQDELVGQGD